ncbi:unnamed protein product [Dovyalis caffra]|uniref:Uncharacterized protein n=1 Tax=Dovyalis caffra TaxID=77055 RepID=A0AAV1SKN6_9ROSI|nr:unnamed protein product [Dovyalis caffra]
MGILIEGWQAFFGGGQEQVLPPYCPYPRFPRGSQVLIGALKVCSRGNCCQQSAPPSSGNEPFDYDPSHHAVPPPLQTLVNRLGKQGNDPPHIDLPTHNTEAMPLGLPPPIRV